jgi:hypothetical protein
MSDEFDAQKATVQTAEFLSGLGLSFEEAIAVCAMTAGGMIGSKCETEEDRERAIEAAAQIMIRTSDEFSLLRQADLEAEEQVPAAE